MLLFLFSWLNQYLPFPLPQVFSYYSTRMIFSSITALLICILCGPKFIKKLYELKIGQTIRTDECPLLGELHANKKDTPTMGGILILFSMVISLLLWMDLQHIFTMILLVTTLVLGFAGAKDDYLKLKYKNTKGLTPKKKMLIQVTLSCVISAYLLISPFADLLHQYTWFSTPKIKHFSSSTLIPLQTYAQSIYLPFLKHPIITLSGFFSLVLPLFFTCVIAGASNAVNLTDGLDGLAAGCLILVASTLGVFAFISNNSEIARYLNILYIEGSGEIAVYLSAFVGACLGFLWYNGHPAQVFMGDTGSLSLGGIIGVSALLLKREFLLVIIGGIFVAEALSVILQVASYKLRNKKRIFLCAPLHHHYEYKGYPETKVVLRFWIIGLLLAIIGIASLKLQ